MVRRQRVIRQVGAALRRIRLDRGIRQYVLAQLVGIDPRVLSRIERGQRFPSVPVLENLLLVLKCSGEEFGCWFGPWGDVEDLPQLGRTGRRRRGGGSGH
jgi:transcriptional regulator with XRE-family HTH domain